MTTSEFHGQPIALVVFESMFGNTERVAREIGEALESDGIRTQVAAVSQAPVEIPSSVELLVVGAPTHAFSLSRPSTRADAVRQGADPARAATGLREWLSSSYHTGMQTLRVAVFDTRVSKVRRLPAAAGPKAARLAKSRQFSLVDKPVAFLVDDINGPLLEGELQRASSWGHSLAAAVQPAAH
jgi:flavodoxin